MSAKVKPLKNNVELDLESYVDEVTGEVKVLAEVPEGVNMSKETGMSMITSNDYAVLETEALLELTKLLNNSDLANVIKMSVVTKTPLNIVFNNTIPHTNETLQKYLEISSKSMFMKLITRLVSAGVLYQIKGRIYGEVRVCYMLNPFLSRKRKVFENKVFDVFEKFRKKECIE
jgi:hypothetical protein